MTSMVRLYEFYLSFNGKIVLCDIGGAVCISCCPSSRDLSRMFELLVFL
jgi:hypothetical protein